jgi:nitroreductase
MEFNDLIRTRESIRDYDPDRKVPSDVLERILDAGRLAPSAANRQPWKFILVSSAEVLEKVKDCYKRDWLKDAPHILIAVGMKDEAWKRSFDGYNAVETDVAIALTHILLAAENEGVGSCWIANFDPDMLKDVINPGPGQTIFGMLPLGYPKPGFRKAGDKKRKNRGDIIEYK